MNVRVCFSTFSLNILNFRENKTQPILITNSCMENEYFVCMNGCMCLCMCVCLRVLSRCRVHLRNVVMHHFARGLERCARLYTFDVFTTKLLSVGGISSVD